MISKDYYFFFFTFFFLFITLLINKIEGLNTLRSGVYNVYQNKLPIFEIISGASIAFAAFLLIVPGFITDLIGFLLLIPFTRKIIIKFFISKNKENLKKNNDYIEGEIINKEKDKDEL